ncbi:MAG: hypothetical protein OHK0053_36130 [Microscillaceae bacterium]
MDGIHFLAFFFSIKGQGAVGLGLNAGPLTLIRKTDFNLGLIRFQEFQTRAGINPL